VTSSHHRQLAIGFIGGGNMAQAIIGGLLRAGHAPDRIAIAEPAAAAHDRLRALDQRLAIGTANATVAAHAELLVLAVKPQVLPDVLAALASVRRPPGQTVLSIAAGFSLERLAAALGPGAALVRVMPNQPALVGAGMAVLVAAPGLSTQQRSAAEYLAGASGEALWLEDESLMDAVTAVSGSGPAYFYLVMEILEATARELGLPPAAAALLVRQTAAGAARAAGLPQADLVALRSSVTSPGGTTAAALAVLEQAGFGEALRRAVIAARDRGVALGRSQN
jgi:pyrroline-5-carboxylate reductase